MQKPLQILSQAGKLSCGLPARCRQGIRLQQPDGEEQAKSE